MPCPSPARLALAALLALASACADGAAGATTAAPEAPVEVTLGRSRLATLPRGIEVSGSLVAREDVSLASRVAGRVLAVTADVGDRVAPGAELARLDPVDFMLEVERRQAALQSALALLDSDEPPGEDFDPSHVPSVVRARQQEANAEARLRRAEALRSEGTGLIPEQEYQDLLTARDVAKSDVDVALQEALARAADSRTRAAELALARQRLADAVLRAPAQGEGWALAERLVAPGEEVSAGQPMFRLVDDAVLKFRAGVPERYLGRVAAGQAVSLSIEAFPQPFAGRVTRLSPDVRPDSRTFLLEAEVPNADRHLAPGAFARGAVMTHDEEGVTLVPEEAVATFAGVSRVFTIEDGRAVEHRVQVRPAGEGELEVLEGFHGALDVVVGGVHSLSAGRTVSVRSAAASP
jgi:RND family efflux transporter MFP subunit